MQIVEYIQTILVHRKLMVCQGDDAVKKMYLLINVIMHLCAHLF